ncbi:peptide deformylase [Cellulosilyticum ruminicola]|uniref:peptide deformylase n=1 Tax=Cellulosilyticum ruminicola TaxID=425254 RepID=UPI0006CF9B61|nr:peptide deformylase [Cellulosilyticum ruminicola]
MAIRAIRTETGNDDLLRKTSKDVKVFDENLWELLDDMAETMYEADGVGIAAPQVGILKRVFIVDIGEGRVEFINPEVLEVSGEQFGEEGCLSVPKTYGKVRRPNYVKLRAFDRHGNQFEIEGEELMARAMLHENDHLNGRLFIDLVEGDLFEVE